MSSHREAPEISKDPVADNTDTYAFVSPDKPDSVTIITNYIPLENPPGGPNFFEFGDDVLYSIYVDNDGDGLPNIEYQFKFKTKLEEREDVPLQHRPDLEHRQLELEPTPVLRRQPGRLPQQEPSQRQQAEAEGDRPQPALPAVQHRPPLDAELPGGARRPGGALAEAAGSTCSPGSGTRGSSSTWGRSSTSATCAPCRTCT